MNKASDDFGREKIDWKIFIDKLAEDERSIPKRNIEATIEHIEKEEIESE